MSERESRGERAVDPSNSLNTYVRTWSEGLASSTLCISIRHRFAHVSVVSPLRSPLLPKITVITLARHQREQEHDEEKTLVFILHYLTERRIASVRAPAMLADCDTLFKRALTRPPSVSVNGGERAGTLALHRHSFLACVQPAV